MRWAQHPERTPTFFNSVKEVKRTKKQMILAAGPIMAALSGAAVGATIGGIGGALIGMGIPEFEAKQYEAKIKEGNILISVHAIDHDVVKRVKEIMKEAGAEDISSTSEARVSDDERMTGVAGRTGTRS